ncbi:NADH-ubiquinone oxidoreductase chain H [Caenispirillum salinarum AK4]|uniref:NADH-ubiquinone oxidoreductase chain H n=1 Tax=Caenispirillum salinarum AK4 TaxID=1238182 RepID=K9GNJ2_9PROT|nr:NADH-quinone oxidoreductase subunit H [Caenispirillum salinarum]EKV26632.1 NADH-ubiquinone oxidoreductase chain H [Caenispirillum salinarum AK4]
MMAVAAFVSLFALLILGTALAAVMDRAAVALASGRPMGAALKEPARRAAALLLRQKVETERPDSITWPLAPVAYLMLAAVGLSVVPFAPGVVVTDISTGIVLWGACEALTVIVVFLHGWSANAPMALIGGYRYVGIGLPVLLLSMFVLIAAALPAESLSVVEIVRAQEAGLWNVVRQPPGLALFLILGLMLTLRGPFDYADAEDLAGGTKAEASGPHRLAWRVARLAMLVSFSAMAATAFLGGYLGPVLPGPLWLVLKTVAVMAAVIAAGHMLARLPPSRMLTTVWVVLLPLSFLVLVLVGVELLLWP